MQRTMGVAELFVGDESGREDWGDLDKLQDSMKKYGFLGTIWARSNGEIIGGRRRFVAACNIGMKEIPVHIHDGSEIDYLEMERLENECQKSLTPSECLKLQKRLEKAYQEQGSKDNCKADSENKDSKDGKEKKKRNREKAAKMVGMSKNTLKKVEEVVQAAENNPQNKELQNVKKEMDETGKISKAHEKMKDIVNPQPLKNGEVDINLAEVPADIKDILNSKIWQNSINNIKQFRNYLESNANRLFFFSMETLGRMDELVEYLEQQKPYCVCPDCQGTKKVNGVACSQCRMGGFLPYFQHKNLEL